MLVYFILVIVPFVVVFLKASGYSVQIVNGRNRQIQDRTNGNAAIVIFFVIYYFLLAFRRSDVGADTSQYLIHYERSLNYGLFRYLQFYTNEHGFYTLIKITSSLIPNEQFSLAVVAIITAFPVMYLYMKESENQMLTLTFFLILPLFTMQFSGLRQSIAIALMVPAYYMVKSRRLTKFILIILLASTFHMSALIGLLLYPLYYMKWSRKMLFFIVPALAILYVFNGQIYLFLIPFLGEEYMGYGEVSETGAYMMLLLFLLCMAFSFFMMENEYADEETLGLRNILVMAAALQCFSVSNPIASRMNYYFMLFIPILIPKIINRSSVRNRKWCMIIGWIMTGYFIFYFFRRAYTGADILETFPYYAFWQ